MMNKDSLWYLEHMDAFEIVQTNVIDRVMQELWQGPYDASGSLFATSTSYGIMTHMNDYDEYDYEADYRFYKGKPKGREVI